MLVASMLVVGMLVASMLVVGMLVAGMLVASTKNTYVPEPRSGDTEYQRHEVPILK